MDKFLDGGHEVFGESTGFLGVVWDGELDEQVGESHYSYADTSSGPGGFADDVGGVVVHVDDVVEHVDCGAAYLL